MVLRDAQSIRTGQDLHHLASLDLGLAGGEGGGELWCGVVTVWREEGGQGRGRRRSWSASEHGYPGSLWVRLCGKGRVRNATQI